MSAAEGRFMVAVGAIIEHVPTGRILLIQRSSRADFSPGIWELISGRMKQFEELDEALRREIAEETGLTDIEIIKPLNASHFYRGTRAADTEIILIMYWVRTTTDRITFSHEHDGYRWLPPHEAVNLVELPAIRRDIAIFQAERTRSAG